MDIFLPDALVANAKATMKDPSCQLVSNGTHHVISFTHDECGTTLTSHDDHVLVENEILVQAEEDRNGTIEFSPNYQVPVKCKIAKRQIVDTKYKVLPWEKLTEIQDLPPISKLTFDLKEYKTEKYDEEIDIGGSGTEIALSSELFLEVVASTDNPSSTGAAVHMCKATPTDNPTDTTVYPLILNGCPTSKAVRLQPSPGVNSFRFSVKVFQFTGAANRNGHVYIHCEVSPGVTSSCNAPGRRRRKRSSRVGSKMTLTSVAHILAK